MDGCYTNLLWRVQNISWRKHFTLSQIYGDFQPLSVTLAKRRAQFAGHAFRAKGEIMSDILLWKVSTGRKLTFPDTISRDTSQIKLFGAKVSVKSRPRPQDNDDDDRGGGGGVVQRLILNPQKITSSEFVYPKKLLAFYSMPKKSLSPFFATQKNSCFFFATQNYPGVFHRPKKITFGQNFRPKKFTRTPPPPPLPVIKICEWSPWNDDDECSFSYIWQINIYLVILVFLTTIY